MLLGLARPAALVLVAALASGCRSSSPFLVFGGTAAPHADMLDCVRHADRRAREAGEDFARAFQLYQRLTSPQAVELEHLSDDFGESVEDCRDRGRKLSERIQAVHSAAQALFRGWKEELALFSGDALRRKSEAMLHETEARAERVLAALERVQARMRPVLAKLQDYALFFHHNLNARAIATLEDTYKEFDAEFRALQGEIGAARREVADFLAALEQEPEAAPTPGN
jgi:hypothetical protein